MLGLDTADAYTIPKPENTPDDLDVEITDVKYVTSYSWLDIPKPTIAVPGQ